MAGSSPLARGALQHADLRIRLKGSSPLARGAPQRGRQHVRGSGLIPARAGSAPRRSSRRRGPTAHPRSRGEHRRRHRSVLVPVGLIPARAGSTSARRGSGRRPRAHPRSRGEHLVEGRPGDALLGSSPLARGARRCHRVLLCVGGLIPARAGSTMTSTSAEVVKTAHPRSRGEHAAASMASVGGVGSSPLARGAQWPADGARGGRGLIPARAGSTQLLDATLALRGAHPRSRGEHSRNATAQPVSFGSSPLAPGAPAAAVTTVAVAGLIPARAGSTRSSSPALSRIRAHPRSRGEHPSSRSRTGPATGSSPLARGAHIAHVATWVAGGLIPARAGSTSRRRCGRGSWAAHPRSRGEHGQARALGWTLDGSSPLARGARGLRPVPVLVGRLIPARAGSTLPGRGWPPRPRAHPRSRGEHPSGAFLLSADAGSSPLARGAPW